MFEKNSTNSSQILTIVPRPRALLATDELLAADNSSLL
jgi:hypothetical protein